MLEFLKRKSTSEWFGKNWKHLETLSWLDELCIWLDTCFKIQPGLLLFKYVSVMLAPQHDNEPPTVPRLTLSHDTTCQCFIATQRSTASKLRGVYPKCSLHGVMEIHCFFLRKCILMRMNCSWALQL